MKTANPKLTAFIAQFEAIYHGSPWYGESFTSILEKTTAKQAFWQPKPAAHSIAQLVAHIIYWRMALIKKLEGDVDYKASMQSEDNWKDLEKLKRQGWKKLLNALEESQQQLVTLLAKQKDSLLKTKYSEKATYEAIINGILQHDLYHIGQVAYLRSLHNMK